MKYIQAVDAGGNITHAGDDNILWEQSFVRYWSFVQRSLSHWNNTFIFLFSNRYIQGPEVCTPWLIVETHLLPDGLFTPIAIVLQASETHADSNSDSNTDNNITGELLRSDIPLSGYCISSRTLPSNFPSVITPVFYPGGRLGVTKYRSHDWDKPVKIYTFIREFQHEILGSQFSWQTSWERRTGSNDTCPPMRAGHSLALACCGTRLLLNPDSIRSIIVSTRMNFPTLVFNVLREMYRRVKKRFYFWVIVFLVRLCGNFPSDITLVSCDCPQSGFKKNVLLVLVNCIMLKLNFGSIEEQYSNTVIDENEKKKNVVLIMN